MSGAQLSLFPGRQRTAHAPEGFQYAEEVIAPAEEDAIAAAAARLDLRAFAFQGFLGKRRVASFGWRYDFNGGGLQKAEPVPDFLIALRERAAAFAGIEASAFENVLVTEYAPGAGIGWHRDRPQFGAVVGVSLRSPCQMRFRRRAGDAWERVAAPLAPRSAYLLDGAAREIWQHSIAPIAALRYSITFRTFRAGARPEPQL